MSTPRIIYTPRPDATPEGERIALAAVYRLILDSHADEETNAAEAQDGDVEAGFFAERHAREGGHSNHRNQRR